MRPTGRESAHPLRKIGEKSISSSHDREERKAAQRVAAPNSIQRQSQTAPIPTAPIPNSVKSQRAKTRPFRTSELRCLG
jgi:hypothetical protein